MSLKQTIVVRKDLKLPKGKMAAQCAHASLDAALSANKKLLKSWLSDGGKKVVVYAESLQQLHALQEQASEAGIISALITDAGHTVVKPGTVTCLAIGPDGEEKIDKIAGELQLV